MAIVRSEGGHRISTVYQCRVVPDLGKKLENVPVCYDSSLIFPTEELAMGYFVTYLRSLYEMKLLAKDQAYKTAIVTLTVFDREQA